MKKAILLLALCAVSLAARADITVVEEVQTAGATQQVTMKVKGDKIRTDVGKDTMSMILDLTSGDMTTLLHQQKKFVTVPGKMKEVIAMAQKMQGDAAGAKITDTGKQEKVGDYNTEIYTMETAAGTTTLWVTKEVPNYAAAEAEMSKLDVFKKMGGQGGPDTSKVDGIPVKIQTAMAGGVTITTTLVSIKEEAIDAADFQAPADYSELKIPALPFGLGGGSSAPSGQ